MACYFFTLAAFGLCEPAHRRRGGIVRTRCLLQWFGRTGRNRPGIHGAGFDRWTGARDHAARQAGATSGQGGEGCSSRDGIRQDGGDSGGGTKPGDVRLTTSSAMGSRLF